MHNETGAASGSVNGEIGGPSGSNQRRTGGTFAAEIRREQLMIVLSHFQTTPLLKARREGEQEATISLDLGLTQRGVTWGLEEVVFPDGQRLTWECIEEISTNEVTCFHVEDNTAKK